MLFILGFLVGFFVIVFLVFGLIPAIIEAIGTYAEEKEKIKKAKDEA